MIPITHGTNEPNAADVLSACHTFQVALRFYVYNVLKTSFVSEVGPMQNWGEPLWGTLNFGTFAER